MSLQEAARTAILQCMGVKGHETVLIIIDDHCPQIGQALWEAAREVAAEAFLLRMMPRQSHGQEPPPLVAQAMLNADVVLAPTGKSLSHTQARRRATERGVRIASMPTITEDIMARTLATDYQGIRERTEPLAELLSRSSEARLTSPAGTDLRLSLKGRTGHADTGIFTEAGAFGNLPAGEAYIAPLEGTARGIIVFDGSVAGVGRIEQPIHIVVEDGYAVRIEGGEEAERLKALIEPHGWEARNIAELGIGTNDRATVTGQVLEDEKAFGTVHIALGNNATIGGTVEVASHLDGLVLKPTLTLDGQVVLRDGTFEVSLPGG